MKRVFLTLIALLSITFSYSQFLKESIRNMKQSDAPSFLRQRGFPMVDKSVNSDGLVIFQGKRQDGMQIYQYVFWDGYPSVNQIAYTKHFTTIQTTDAAMWVGRNRPLNLYKTDMYDNKIVIEDDSTIFEEEKEVWEVHRIPNNSNFIIVVKYQYYYQPVINRNNSNALLNTPTLKFGDTILNLNNEDTYDLVNMFQNFVMDFMNFSTPFLEKYKLAVNINELKDHTGQFSLTPNLRFQIVDKNIIALAIGKDDNSKVDISFHPDYWLTFNQPKRFYVFYHELGHDIFNLNHGNGGKMMFNYAERDITWDDFFEDRESMFERVLANFLN